MLFVQGSADTFGTADEIRALVPALQNATLYEVTGGDHGFKVPKRVASAEAVMQSVIDTTAAWARRVLS
jgi:predicted alpha/beta-hydrolase family hydrolase